MLQNIQLSHSITRRLNNFSLSPSPDNSLIGVYEAISNSIHAASDTGMPEKVIIEIETLRNSDGEIDGFKITDNGVGLTQQNFDSFRNVDSDFKFKRGGKGVGRLMWLKTFDSVSVESQFLESEVWQYRSFKFALNDSEPFGDYSVEQMPSGPQKTVVTLQKMKPQYQAVAPKKAETIAKVITRHFVKDLISPSAPRLIFKDGGTTVLNDLFRNNISRTGSDDFEVTINGEIVEFRLQHFLVSNHLKDQDTNENTMYFLAHGRVVERRAVGGLIGLKRLSNGQTYLGLIESEFFNSSVSVERTMFTWNSEVIDLVTRAAAEKAVIFLATETKTIRERQIQILQLLRRDFPRYIGTIGDPTVFATKLPLAAHDQEAIFRAVSLTWYRNKRRMDREIRVSFSKATTNETIKEAVEKMMGAVDEETKAVLADYVAERKVVIDVLDDLLGKQRTGRYALEREIHDLVCPRKATTDTTGFDAHNLWLIDERLPYYSFFNSDKTISQQTNSNGGAKRPDITFFDLAISFQQQKEPVPVIVVEFKKPGRNDYTSADNPVDQCLEYVRLIKRGDAAIDSSGKHVSWIRNDTLFYCYVIADITPSLVDVLEKHDLIKTPDGRGYWKFHDRLHTIIEVLPFDKVIETTRARHEAFFSKLGIN